MKSLSVLFLLTAAAIFAQSPAPATAPAPAAPASAPAAVVRAPAQLPTSFPGLKIILTPEEYSRAGLDALTPDQIGVIDAALIRHYSSTVTAAANQVVERMQLNQQEQVQQAVNQAVTEDRRSNWLARVGLPNLGGDWRNEPSIKAKCIGWASGNSFKLDNGQTWAGIDPIRMELNGHDIEIQPRPDNQFTLYVDGKNTSLGVLRVE